jgi:hypothetical protein
MTPREKMGLGAPLAAIGAAFIILSFILDWTSLARPWAFLIGFFCGVSAGTGAALAIVGLIEHGRG